MTLNDEGKAHSTSLALPLAGAATAFAVLVLAWTEKFSPAGSGIAWLVVLALLAAHLPLLGGAARRAIGRLPAGPTIPGLAVGAVAALFVAVCTVQLAHAHVGRIFQTPVIPRQSAQMGLMVQAAARLQAGTRLYAVPMPRDGYDETNPLPAAATLPFLVARAWALDWRYASLAALLLTGAVLTAGVLRAGISQRNSSLHSALFLAGAAFAGAGWFLSFRTAEYLQWGAGAPLWALIALLGASLAARWHLAAALTAGLLASMSPGWLLLAPLLGILLWREEESVGRRALLAALLVLPALAGYGAFRGELAAQGEGIIGAAFREGLSQQREGSWRFPTLHGLGDFLGLRWAVIGAALLAQVVIGRKMLAESCPTRRRELFAFAAFVLIAAAPAAWFFHWQAHALLLAALCLPQFTMRLDDGDGRGFARHGRDARATAMALVPVGVAAAVILAGVLTAKYAAAQAGDGAIDRVANGEQRHDKHLLAGFNVWSEDHVWGRDKAMAIGFVLEQPGPGFLELKLASMGGDFTPFNPATIKVNGRTVGIWRDLPGESSIARIALLNKGDVHRGFNVVELETPWARTPKSYNVSEDTRLVSIGYLGMRWVRLTGSAESGHSTAVGP